MQNCRHTHKFWVLASLNSFWDNSWKVRPWVSFFSQFSVSHQEICFNHDDSYKYLILRRIWKQLRLWYPFSIPIMHFKDLFIPRFLVFLLEYYRIDRFLKRFSIRSNPLGLNPPQRKRCYSIFWFISQACWLDTPKSFLLQQEPTTSLPQSPRWFKSWDRTYE